MFSSQLSPQMLIKFRWPITNNVSSQSVTILSQDKIKRLEQWEAHLEYVTTKKNQTEANRSFCFWKSRPKPLWRRPLTAANCLPFDEEEGPFDSFDHRFLEILRQWSENSFSRREYAATHPPRNHAQIAQHSRHASWREADCSSRRLEKRRT